MSKLYFKGLDTYRAIAALLVLISHVELFKSKYKLNNYLGFSFFENTGGHISVVLFFALSGFLITYLLVEEKTFFHKISLKNFYMRRILRVWPLYFLVILLSYFLTDYIPSFITLLLCLTIFPNIAQAIYQGWAVSPQIWSIGVEEQFYLIWPFLIKKFKNILMVSIFIFVLFSLLPHFILFILNRFYPNPEIMKTVNALFYGTKFNCMASGAIFATIYHKRYKLLLAIYEYKTLNYVLIILPFFLWIYGFHLKYFTDEIYSILFSVSILLVSTNPGIYNIDNRLSKYLGKISYGIYMYHWIILELIFRNKLFNYNSEAFGNILLYGFTLGLTLTISAISYNYIEKPILRLKDRYN